MLKIVIAQYNSKRKKKKGWVVLLKQFTNSTPRMLLSCSIYGRFKTKSKAEARRKALLKEIRNRGE